MIGFRGSIKKIAVLRKHQMNAMLTNLPSFEEVKIAVFNLNTDGAPGPDGFGNYFFQHYWDIVGDDVFHVVSQFFQQNWLPRNYNSNNLILIPKTPDAALMEHYRPIALANFKFEIITKVLVDRLSQIMPNIISLHQRGFI
jgi:hypothetical protein